MKAKINKIELSNFRGFKGHKIIDLEDAEFVILHGLNGFGKTSVFDAIEWGLTGHLGRYKRYLEKGYKANFTKEKEVLRNKDATSEETFVKIHLNNNSTFGRKIPKGIKGQDYTEGALLEGTNFNLNDLAISGVDIDQVNDYFSSTHLLSQEQINSFITNKKPEERYDAVSINFGTGSFHAFEDNHQKVSTVLNQQSKEIQINHDTQENLKKDLEKDLMGKLNAANDFFKDAVDKIEDLRKTSQEFNSYTIKAQEDQTYIINPSFEEVSHKIDSEKKKLQESQLIIKELHYLNDNYLKWRDYSQKNEKDKLKGIELEEKLKKSQAHVSQIDKLKKEQKPVDALLEVKSNELLDLKYQYENVDDFIRRENEINNYSNIIIKDKLEQASVEKKLSLSSRRELELVADSLQLNESMKIIDNLIMEIKSYKSLFGEDSFKLFLKKQNQASLLNKKQSSQFNEFLKSVEIDFKKNEIGTLSKKKIKFSSLDSVPEELGNLSSINHLILQSSEFNRLIDLLIVEDGVGANVDQQLFQEELKLSKNDSILSQAIELINLNTTDSNGENCNCPVCDSSFKKETLLGTIRKNIKTKNSEAIEDLRKRQKENQVNRQKNLKAIDILSKEINDTYNSIRNSINEKLSALRFSLEKIEVAIDNCKNIQIKIAECSLTSISKIFDENLSVGNMLKTIEEKRNELSKDLLKFDKDKSKVILEKTEFGNSLKEINLRIQKHTTAIEELKNNIFLKLSISFTVYRENDSDINLKEVITQKIKDVEKIIEDQVDLSSKSVKDIKAIMSLLDSTGQPASLIENIKLINNDIVQHEKWIDDYNAKLTFCKLKKEAILEHGVEKIFDKEKDNISYNENIINKLESLKVVLLEIISINKLDPLKKRIAKIQEDLNVLGDKKNQLLKKKEVLDEFKHEFPTILQAKILANLDPKLFNTLYKNLNPHQRFSEVELKVLIKNNTIGIDLEATENGKNGKPEYLFSSAQLNTLGVCLFLSMALRQNWLKLDTLLLDDPVQNLDDINVLALIDLLRSIVQINKKQIFISTHDERLYGLLQKKLSGHKCKFINFSSYGTIEVT